MKTLLTLPSWRTTLAVGFLIVLLTWETVQPTFALFAQRIDRARHAAKNLALGALNSVIVAFVFAGAWLAVTRWSESHQFGLLRWMGLSPIFRAVFAVLLLDFWTYGWHRLNHRVPLFWRFHRWHHADSAMDVTTASRFHSGEIFLSSLFRLPVLLLIGCKIEDLALYELMAFAVIQFHHANIDLPARLDRFLRLFIVTPSLHKVHHSTMREEHDSNFTSLFSWWDPCFRTRRFSPAPDKIIFGLEEE